MATAPRLGFRLGIPAATPFVGFIDDDAATEFIDDDAAVQFIDDDGTIG